MYELHDALKINEIVIYEFVVAYDMMLVEMMYECNV